MCQYVSPIIAASLGSMPDDRFTPTTENPTHRLVYRGSVPQANGAEVIGSYPCTCHYGCDRKVYRLRCGRTLVCAGVDSVVLEPRPEPTEADLALAALFEQGV